MRFSKAWTTATAACTTIRPAGTPRRVIRRNHQTGAVSLGPLRWGLIPHQCQDPKGGRKPINSKRETVVMSALTGSRYWSAGNSVVMGQQETLRFTSAILANAPRVA